jgi:DNA-binding NarL/FixJ family response regulator
MTLTRRKKNRDLLIVDDHKLMLDGLRRLLQEQEGVTVKDVACGGEEALQKLSENYYDFILLDISMPGMNGIETLRELRKRKINTPVIMITMHHDFMSAAGALNAGANGYILKDSGIGEIIAAMEVIALGGTFISPEVREMLQEMNNMNKDFRAISDPYKLLSERELQIARMFASGSSSQEIAKELFISQTTIETHRRNIFNKLKIKKTTALIKFLYDNGLM